jgi:hypothetical protein
MKPKPPNDYVLQGYSPMQVALFRLNAAILRGEEFPDAAHRVARSANVKQADLEKAYDDQFASTGWMKSEDVEIAVAYVNAAPNRVERDKRKAETFHVRYGTGAQKLT